MKKVYNSISSFLFLISIGLIFLYCYLSIEKKETIEEPSGILRGSSTNIKKDTLNEEMYYKYNY